MGKKDKDNLQKKLLAYEFPVDLEPKADGNIEAHCPWFPGVRAQGKTAREALDHLKHVLDNRFTTTSVSLFEKSDVLKDIPTLYAMTEYRGHLYIATSRDCVLKSGSGAPGSWKPVTVTGNPSRFFNPTPGGTEGAGDYVTQVYGLCRYAAPGRDMALYAGTNLNGSVYMSGDGEVWREAFATGEDRVHTLCVFNDMLFAGTSSKGHVYAFDGVQWNTVGSLNEVAVTALAVFQNRLYAGTYPSGILFSTENGLAWQESTATGSSFVQCMKEFKGALYAGTSSANGVAILKTENGRDWIRVYEGMRELNVYCLEEFEGALYAGTGNAGRILRTLDGEAWETVHAGDYEGVRCFAAFDDYLWGGTDNPGVVLKSTFDAAAVPHVKGVEVVGVSSCDAHITWETDIPSTTELQVGPIAPVAVPGSAGKDDITGTLEFPLQVVDRTPVRRHNVHLTDLKSDTSYHFKVSSRNRSSSSDISELFLFRTEAIPGPELSCATHPDPVVWSKDDTVRFSFETNKRWAGYYYRFDQEPGTIPMVSEAEYTEKSEVVFPNTPQGRWYLHVVGVDDSGNVGGSASHYPVLIDTEAAPPPVLRSVTHPDPLIWVSNPSPLVEWDAPEDLSGVKGYWVHVDREPGTLPGPNLGRFTGEPRYTFGPLEDGQWYVHVVTEDLAGNVGREAAHFALRVDTKALPPTLSSPTHPDPAQWYSLRDVTLTWIPPRELSGVAGYYVFVDRHPETVPLPDASRWTEQAKAVVTGLEDGSWYLHVRTKDKAGNLSSDAAHLLVRVDTVAPPPVLTSPTHADPQKWYNQRRVTVTWEDPEDESGVVGYFYGLDQRAATVPGAEEGLWTTQRQVTLELVDDGIWWFHVTAKDKAGNVGTKAAHLTLKVDTQVGQPRITSSSHPDERAWTSNPRARFVFTPPEDKSGIEGYYYQFMDQEAPSWDPGKAHYTERTELFLDIPHEGVHTMMAVCRDAAGNQGLDPARYTVRLDTSVPPPKITSKSHPNPAKWYAARRLEVAWDEPADLSGVEGYYFVFNREETWPVDLKVMQWTLDREASFQATDDGPWIVHVCAKDKAGNVGQVSRFKFLVDSKAVPPTVKSPSHPKDLWTRDPNPRFSWEAPRELSGVAGYYFLLDQDPQTIPTPQTGKWVDATAVQLGPLADGEWFFHIIAKDGVGNLSETAFHYPVRIDLTAPKSRILPFPPFLDKSRIPVAWEASDPLSGVTTFDVQVKEEGKDWVDCLMNTTEQNGVFPGADGKQYWFRCRARDAAGNEEAWSEEGISSVRVDISPPPPVTELHATPRAGGDIELTWTAVTDPVSGTSYYRVYRKTDDQPKHRISIDGQVMGTRFVDKGTNLKEGQVYYYTVHPVDKMGNEQHEGNYMAAAVSDHGVGAPVVSCASHKSDAWSNNPNAVFTWIAPPDTTGVAGYHYILDGEPGTRPGPGKGHYTTDLRVQFANVPTGIWYFHIVAQDKAGNLSPEPVVLSIKVDAEPPAAPRVTSPTHPEKHQWYSSAEVELRVEASGKASGLDGFLWYVDANSQGNAAQRSDIQRSFENSIHLVIPGSGMWYIHVAVKDKAGNISPCANYLVRVASGTLPPPLVHSNTHPQEDRPESNNHPVFTWEDKHDGSFSPVGYVYRLSPQETVALNDKDLFTAEKTVQLRSVGEGTWWFHVSAVGPNGQPSPLTAKHKIVIRRVGGLTGRFMAKDGQTPVVGAKVEIARADRVLAAAVTDNEGNFKLAEIPEGKHELRLYGPDAPVLALRDIPVDADRVNGPYFFIEDMGVFPLPAEPGPIRIYYLLKEDCNVTVEIFDGAESLIDKVEEKKQGGAYAVTIWDALGRPEGDYMFKLSAKNLTKNSMSRFSVKKFQLRRSQTAATATP